MLDFFLNPAWWKITSLSELSIFIKLFLRCCELAIKEIEIQVRNLLWSYVKFKCCIYYHRKHCLLKFSFNAKKSVFVNLLQNFVYFEKKCKIKRAHLSHIEAKVQTSIFPFMDNPEHNLDSTFNNILFLRINHYTKY